MRWTNREVFFLFVLSVLYFPSVSSLNMKLVHVFWSPVTILGCILTFSNRGESVKIKEIQVPDFVQNGTTSPVVLDCDYILEKDEDPRGLTVKWFFDDDPTPVYQWAYGYKPQASGPLSGRVNLEYRASSEEIKASRSIHIINPTFDLTGNYRCQVATFKNEESKNKNMTIYVPVSKMSFTVTKPEHSDTVNVTCDAEGSYPKPEMTIFTNKKEPSELGTKKNYTSSETNNTIGIFDVSTILSIGDDDLDKKTIFECELRIPGTNYSLIESYTYYPGSAVVPAIHRALFLIMLSISCLRL